MSEQRLLASFLGIVAGLSTVYFLTQERLFWVLVGLTSAVAVGVGIVRHQPRRVRPWWVVAAALLTLTLGELAGMILRTPDGAFPTAADPVHVAAGLPLLIAGGYGLARTGVRPVDRASLLDALIITSGVALLSWMFLISPVIADPAIAGTAQLVAVAYPVVGVLLLVVVIQLAIGVRWRPGTVLPIAGLLGMLAVEAGYGIAQLRGDGAPEPVAALGWFLLYAGWGAGALHPSMTSLVGSRGPDQRDLTRHRFVLLVAGALVPPVVLSAEALTVPLEIAVRRELAVALSVLVLARMYVVYTGQRRALARERGLHRAGAAFVTATATTEVAEAVRAAVGSLLPPGVPHEVVLEYDTSAPAGPARIVAPRASPDGSVHPADPSTVRLPGTPDAVLRCPMTVTDGHGPGETIGVVYIAADEAALLDLRTSAEVVAAQAALALERIRLTKEINVRASEEYFRTLVQHTADMILIVDEEDTIRYASPSATAMFGQSPTRLRDLVAPEDRPVLDRAMAPVIAGSREGTTAVECTVVTGDGRRIRVEASFRDLRDDPTVAGVVVTLHDVTEQRQLQQQLTHLAFHDVLTGLPNRALFYERLEHALVRGAHEDMVAGVLFVDMDGLKTVNDTMGHAAGDQLLVAVGRRLSDTVGAQDTAARLGGDEFAVLIEGASGRDEVDAVAQRVVAAFRGPFPLGGRMVSGAVSVGVAIASAGDTSEDLMRQADLALYAAKSAGKGGWRRFTDPVPQHDGRSPPAPAGRAPAGGNTPAGRAPTGGNTPAGPATAG